MEIMIISAILGSIYGVVKGVNKKKKTDPHKDFIPEEIKEHVNQDGVTVKNCPFCSEEILANAKKCKHCGEYLDPVLAKTSAPQQINVGTKKWNPALAAVLSMFFPGLGHLYKGKILSGFIWFVVVVCGYMMLIVPGIILHLICIAASATGNTEK